MFSTGTNLASKTPKKFKKMSVSYLVPVLLVEKGPKKIQKKNAKMNSGTLYFEIKNLTQNCLYLFY